MSRSSDEQFEYDLQAGHAVEDYSLKNLRRLGYSGSVDHRLLRPKCEDRQHSCQSDLGDVCLWHEDYGTTIADFKSLRDLIPFLPAPVDEVLPEMIESPNFNYLWIAQDSSITKVLVGEIDISHHEFFLCARPEFQDGPDGLPAVATHIPWLIRIPGNSFPSWQVKRRRLSEDRRRDWYCIAVDNPALEIIDLTLETLKVNQYSSHNPTAGNPFDWLHKVHIDLNSYKQETNEQL